MQAVVRKEDWRQDRHALTLRWLVCCMPAGMQALPSRTAHKATHSNTAAAVNCGRRCCYCCCSCLQQVKQQVRHVQTCTHSPLRGPLCSPAGTSAAPSRHRGSAWRGAGPAGQGQATHTQPLSTAPARAAGGVGGGGEVAYWLCLPSSPAAPWLCLITTTCSSGNQMLGSPNHHLPSARHTPLLTGFVCRTLPAAMNASVSTPATKCASCLHRSPPRSPLFAAAAPTPSPICAAPSVRSELRPRCCSAGCCWVAMDR